MAPKSILVTGSAGFIASNFIAEFKKRFPKTQIVGIDDLSSGRRDRIPLATVFYEGSICDPKILDRIFAKHRPEYVFHFAALPRVAYSVEHPTDTTTANVVGTVALLEKSKNHGVKRFIYSSSSSIYGGAKNLPTNEKDNPPNPVSPYALQKYVGESFLKIFSELYGLDTVSLRYFNVFGPGQYGDAAYSTVVCAWLETLYAPTGKKPFIEGDGKQSRDFCYVGNIVEANILAMLSKNPLKGVGINVGNGERVMLRTVKALIEKETGKKLDLVNRPPRLGDVRHTHADIRLAKKLLGYKPEVDFESGLRKTIQWFETRKH